MFEDLFSYFADSRSVKPQHFERKRTKRVNCNGVLTMYSHDDMIKDTELLNLVDDFSVLRGRNTPSYKYSHLARCFMWTKVVIIPAPVSKSN